MALKFPIRLSKAAAHLNISLRTIEELLSRAGHSIEPRPNYKLSRPLFEVLIKKHGRHKLIQEYEEEYGFSAEQVQSHSKYTPLLYASEFDILFSEEDCFANREKKILTQHNISTKTIFSDFEAFSICRGLKNSKARKAGNKYFKNPKENHDKVFAHSTAMAALAKYGSHFLSYIIKLPPLPFQTRGAQNILAALDARKVDQKSPAIRLLHKNRFGQNEKLIITFNFENKKDFKKRDDNTLLVRNLTTKKKLMTITRTGQYTPFNEADDIKPITDLFIRVDKSGLESILNYGIETGECSVCGRPLTDPESLKRGIGPVCYENISPEV